MRTIVAGSRTITSLKDVDDAIHFSNFNPSVIISGGAKGVDSLGEQWAALHSVPLEVYPAEWDKYGRGAGFKRNALMATKADALVAIWDGQSRGTNHMINIAKTMGLKLFVYEVYNWSDTNYKLPDWTD